jgi:hypothetical protein
MRYVPDMSYIHNNWVHLLTQVKKHVIMPAGDYGIKTLAAWSWRKPLDHSRQALFFFQVEAWREFWMMMVESWVKNIFTSLILWLFYSALTCIFVLKTEGDVPLLADISAVCTRRS